MQQKGNESIATTLTETDLRKMNDICTVMSILPISLNEWNQKILKMSKKDLFKVSPFEEFLNVL